MIGTIPSALQEDITELRRPAPVYDPDSGGQYVQQPAQEIRFRGSILPMSTDELRRAPQGAYTPNTRKLYTTHTLLPGSQIMAAGKPILSRGLWTTEASTPSSGTPLSAREGQVLDMLTLRNVVARGLYAYLQRPVVLSDQVVSESDMPYIYYQTVQPYMPLGGSEITYDGRPWPAPSRLRPPSATWYAAPTGSRTSPPSVGTMRPWPWPIACWVGLAMWAGTGSGSGVLWSWPWATSKTAPPSRWTRWPGAMDLTSACATSAPMCWRRRPSGTAA